MASGTTPSCPSPGPPPNRNRSRNRNPPVPAAPPGLLNHPALTGLDPADLTALAAALAVPFRARREQRRYLRHGRARQLAEGASGGGSNRKLDLTDHLLATRMRQHLNLSPKVIGALLGAHGTTIGHATTLTASLLAGQPQPPAARRPASACAPSATCANTPPATASPSTTASAATRPPQIAHYKPPTHPKPN